MAISKDYLRKAMKKGIETKVSSMVKKGYTRSKKKSKNRSLRIANIQAKAKEAMEMRASQEQAQKTQTSIIDKTRASKINYKTGLIEGEYAKTGIGEKLLTGKGLFAEGQEVAKGTVPFGPAGGAGGYKAALGKIGAGKAGAIWKGGKDATKVVSSAKTVKDINMQGLVKSATKVANMFGKDPKKVLNSLKYLRYKDTINTIAKKPNTALKVAKWVIGAGATVMSTDVLMQWYALDNGIGGTKFFVMNVDKKIDSGEMNPADALLAAEEAERNKEVLINKVKLSNTINPLMWAFRNMILAGVEVDQQQIDLSIESIREKADASTEPPEKQDYSKLGLDDEAVSKLEELDELELTYSQESIIAGENTVRIQQELAELKIETAETINKNYNRSKEKALIAEAKYWAEANRLALEHEAAILAMRAAYWEIVNQRQLDSASSTLSFGLFR